MSRTLTFSLLALALFIGAAGYAPVAHALTNVNGSACDYTNAGSQDGKWQNDVCVSNSAGGTPCDYTNDGTQDGILQNGVCVPNDTHGPAVTTAKSDANTVTKVSTGPVMDSYLAQFMSWVASLFAWLLGVAAITLDNSVHYTVVTMGEYVKNLTAVGVTWQILRDIGNIFLIFGFLAIGITTILNVDWYGGGKKMLPMLIVGAVFLNFSLFITQAVIDVGNLFATQFYTQINGGNPSGAKNFDMQSVTNEGISNKLMNQLGLTKIYASARQNGQVLVPGSSIFIGFMSIIVFLIAAFVMFSLAFILIARFVILLFLIILAPIGFAGLAIPQMKKTAEMWWHKLFEQTITAPILLLLLYIALAVITDTKFLSFGGAGDWAGFVQTSAGGISNLTGFASMVLSFLVAMGLLLAVVMVSKSLSSFGGSWATKMAGKLSFGATAWAGRATVGTVVGRVALGNRFVTRGAVSNNRLIKYGSRLIGFTGKRLQNRTFDVRNIPGAGTAFGALNIEAGTASTLTAKQLQEKQYGAKAVKEWWRNASKEYEKDAAELKRKSTVANPAAPDFTRTLKKMSADELAELRGIRKALPPYVAALSPAKYAELQKSDKLLQPEKDNLKAAWNAQFVPGAAAATVARFTTEEIATLDGDLLAMPGVVDVLGATEFEAIRRKGNLTTAQRHAIHARMVDPAAPPALAVVVGDYFALANDPGQNREKYWNV